MTRGEREGGTMTRGERGGGTMTRGERGGGGLDRGRLTKTHNPVYTNKGKTTGNNLATRKGGPT